MSSEARRPAESSTGSHAKVEPQPVGVLFLAALPIVVVIAFVVVIHQTGLTGVVYVSSAAMRSTLEEGDLVAVRAATTRETSPRQGDIVVLVSPEDPRDTAVLRVVATAGDVVEIREKQLRVNDVAIEEPWIRFADRGGPLMAPRDVMDPVTVPDGTVFVMGDNRDRSYDSRFWGPVPLAAVRSVPVVVLWSFDERNGAIRWGRIGQLVPSS